ncbi:MAG TPA: DUF3455 domain-containing protein [Blastocatellia bacterium]|nr:DUF3455 domain-containing protein [Blastocatellia bacterium]
MRHMKMNLLIVLVAMLALAGIAPLSISAAQSGDRNRTPELPSPLCDDVQVPEGNRLALRTYARGIQRYRWNGESWIFVEPVATLYADAGYHGKVGIHYAGPTWESNSGGKVVAALVSGCSPDPAAIPWLRLQATANEGPGIFSSVTYIHRVNTVGGLAPTAPGSNVGMIVDVPYTAEYYFYRASH